MKKVILLMALLGLVVAHGQVLEPVKWSTSVKKITVTEDELIATATIDNGWHLYSQVVPEDGPIPTRFSYQSNEKYLKKGNTQEESGETVFDPVFEMDIKYFDSKATFKQRIRLKGKVPFTVKGTVEFMVCDESRCLPPTEVELVFNVK